MTENEQLTHTILYLHEELYKRKKESQYKQILPLTQEWSIPLHIIRLQLGLVVNNNVVSWGDRALTNMLTDEIEVIPANTRGENNHFHEWIF